MAVGIESLAIGLDFEESVELLYSSGMDGVI